MKQETESRLAEISDKVFTVVHAAETGRGVVEGVRALASLYKEFGAPDEGAAMRNFCVLCVCFGDDAARICRALAPRGTLAIPETVSRRYKSRLRVGDITNNERQKAFIDALTVIRNERLFDDGWDESTIPVPAKTISSTWQTIERKIDVAKDFVEIFSAVIRRKKNALPCTVSAVAKEARLPVNRVRYLLKDETAYLKWFFRLMPEQDATARLESEKKQLAYLEKLSLPKMRRGKTHSDWSFLFPFPLNLHVEDFLTYYKSNDENLLKKIAEHPSIKETF